MKLTIEVPDALAARLRPHEGRLGRLLELGLEAQESVGSPTPEELVAYAQRRLDDAEHEAMAERLALDAEAVDDLLDFQHFEELEPPSAGHALSTQDVGQAWSVLRDRLTQEDAAVDHSVPSSTAESAQVIRPSRWQRPALALVASLAMVIAGWSLHSSFGPGVDSVAVDGQLISIAGVRGADGETHVLEEGADRIILAFEKVDLLGSEASGTLEVWGPDNTLVHRQDLPADSGSFIVVPLQRDRLPPGGYRARAVRSVSFILADTAPPP